MFYLLDSKLTVGNKLNSRKRGPYEVLEHANGSNVVVVKDLVTDTTIRYNQKDLQLFIGSRESAIKLARLDDDQFIIDRILGYTGDPEKRSSMQFLVCYEDGEELFVKYSLDISSTKAFEDFYIRRFFFLR